MGALLLCCCFYLIGAFPTGYLIARLHGVNISEHGSGNVGATNLSRVLGKRAGILTLLGDMLKGFLPLLLIEQLGYSGNNLGCLGLFLVLGHCFSIPPWLKGGKGIATSLGVFFGLSPIIAVLALTTFGAAMAIWRIVSLASVLTAALIPIYAMLIYADYHQPYLPWLMGISTVAVYRHRENLQRMILGQEKRFEFSKQTTSQHQAQPDTDNSA